MTPFLELESMPTADADEYLRAFVSVVPERVAWLREALGADLPPDSTGLVPAWAGYLRWWDDEGGSQATDGTVPLWWRDPAPGELLAPPALRWVDALACYWATVLMSEYPQLEWRRFDEGDASIDIHNRPVLRLPGDDPFAFEPVTAVYVLVLRVLHGEPAPRGRTYAPSEPEALLELHGMRIRHIERALSKEAAR